VKIYTKIGDTGETSLFGGKRVSKDALRIETYGTVDELNSILGVCRSMNTAKEVDAVFEEIQNDLFALGADLATPVDTKNKSVKRITSLDVSRLEQHIDAIQPKLTPLTSFILPGGSRTASMVHFARTVCRRAERLVVHLNREEPIGEQDIIFLNRLSDLLFVIARWINALGNTPETKWKP
jgi:cob(I)alamin adenosyltransferase